MVSTAEKFALDIQIFTLSRGLRAQISRSSAQEKRFQRLIFRQFGRTAFFNRIGQKRSVDGAIANEKLCIGLMLELIE